MASRLVDVIRTHRMRLSRIALVLAVLAIGVELHGAVPQETPVTFQLGTNHNQVTELRVAYVQEGLVHHGAHFRYPLGAPQDILHRVDLPAGTYAVECDLMHRDGSRQHVTRDLSVPTEGQLRLRIEP